MRGPTAARAGVGRTRFEILTKQLHMTGYRPDPPESRTSLIPESGQAVALQTQLGTVVDGEPTLPMEVDIDTIEPHLAALVAHCQERTGSD